MQVSLLTRVIGRGFVLVCVRFKGFLRLISIEDLSTITAFAIAEVSWIYSRTEAISFTQAILNVISKHLGK